MNNMSSSSLLATLVELPAVIGNLLLLLSEKEKTVIQKRFCLNSERKHTLDEIGQDFSVTRERVRQIEKNALSKMRRNVFNTGLRNLHDFSSETIKSFGGLVNEFVLLNEFKSLLDSSRVVANDAHIHLALVLHEDVTCVGNTINFHPYVRENGVSDYSLKSVSDKLVNQLHKYGDARKLDRIHVDLKKHLDEAKFDVRRMRSLIDIDKRVTILDDDVVGLLEWRHIHPRTLRDKILFVLRNVRKPMHFLEISNQISSAAFDNRCVNVQAVHNELIRHNNFVLIGRGIYALAEWGFERGTVAKVIEKILNSEKELSQDKIVEMVLKSRQVKEITVVLALKNNPQFERVGRKRYRLRSSK